MTDAYDELRDDLEAARTSTESALAKARNAEQTAWALYKNGDWRHEHRQAWHEAHSAAGMVGAALGMLDRACKAVADTAGGVPEVETAP